MSLNLRWITHPSDWFLGATSSRMDWQAHGNEVWKVFGPGHTRKRHGGGKNSCSSVKAHQSWARPEQIHTIKYDFTIKTARFKCWYDQAFRYGRREGLWHTRGKTNTHTSLCESEGRSHCGCIKVPELATVIPARLLNQCFFFMYCMFYFHAFVYMSQSMSMQWPYSHHRDYGSLHYIGQVSNEKYLLPLLSGPFNCGKSSWTCWHQPR